MFWTYDTNLAAFWNEPSSVDLKVIDVNPDLLSETINREPTTIFDMAVRGGPAVSHLFSTSEVITLMPMTFFPYIINHKLVCAKIVGVV